MAKAGKRPPADAPKSATGVDKDRYRAEAGRQDLILILCEPRWTPKHWTGTYYLDCLQGENEPCCEHFGKPAPSNTSYILHVASRQGNGPWQTVGKPMVWGFGDDKWAQYQTILRDHCDNDFAKLRGMLLSITCQNTSKQKLFVSPYPKTDVTPTAEMVKNAKARKEMFDDDITLDRSDVLRSLQEMGASTGFAPEESASADTSFEPAAEEGPGEEAPPENVDSEIDNLMAEWD